jgi:hypothetical protein
MDKRKKLEENRFSYKVSKREKVFIYFDRKEIMVLKNLEAQELIRTLEDASTYEVQYYLATITGNFKHGNEKISKENLASSKDNFALSI